LKSAVKRCTLQLVLTVLLGFLIATAIAVTGVGAGTVTAPALILWLGVSPATAVGTALTFGAIVKIPAAISYVRKKLVHWPTAIAMLAGGIPGVVIGSTLLESMDRQKLEAPILIGVGAVVVISAGYTLMRAAFGAKSRATPADPFGSRFRLRRLGLLSVPIGLEVGFSSAGAGALGTLAVMYATPLAPAAVVGTDIIFGLGLSSVGSGLHLAIGSFDNDLIMKLVAGGLVGSVFGSNISALLPARTMRMILLVWLTYIGSALAYKGFEKYEASRTVSLQPM
jgi:uncharacterized membrane protein YfcA